MSVIATISPGYRWRPGVFALASIVFGTWFLYDGYVVYPRDVEIFVTHRQFKQENRIRNGQWYDHVRKQGWPVGENEDNPGVMRTTTSIMTQRVLGIFISIVGVISLIVFLRTLGRWIACDEQGLTTSWGLRAPFDAITRIDLGRWDAKGIAVVEYDDGPSKRKITLDDWKYDRQATAVLVDLIKSKLAVDPES